jgi:hypothetical protein
MTIAVFAIVLIFRAQNSTLNFPKCISALVKSRRTYEAHSFHEKYIFWRIWGLYPFPSCLSYTSVICLGSSDTNLSRLGFRDKELMMDTSIWRSVVYSTADAASLLHFTSHTKSLLHSDTNKADCSLSLKAYCFGCLLLHNSVDTWFFTAWLILCCFDCFFWSDCLIPPRLWSASVWNALRPEVGSWNTD